MDQSLSITRLNRAGLLPRPADPWPPPVRRLTLGARLEGATVRPAASGGLSERTKAALRAARARGVKLGSPKSAETIAAARDARSRYARSAARPIKMIFADIQRAGVTSLSDIAKALQARGIRTPAGKTNWHAGQVARLLAK